MPTCCASSPPRSTRCRSARGQLAGDAGAAWSPTSRAVFVTAFGVAGGVMLALFLTDLAIALLSRTVPQMNVLCSASR